MNGKREVGTYLGNYDRTPGWHMRLGFVEGRPAIIGSELADPARPSYFVLLEWQDGKVLAIRDFRHARYAIEGAEIVVLE
jgi:RNA polymerase sigma-70 factor (ECF subfamily)